MLCATRVGKARLIATRTTYQRFIATAEAPVPQQTLTVAYQSYFQHKSRSVQLSMRPGQSDITPEAPGFEPANKGEATHNVGSRLDLVTFLVADDEVRK